MIKMLIIQLIGALAFITLAASYYQKDKKNILLMEIFSYIFFSIHFYLLSGITGVICNIIGLLALVSLYLFDKYKPQHKLLIAIFYVVLLIIVNVVTFQNIYSIFPMIALIIVIMSFTLNKENQIRIAGGISAMSWLIYAIKYDSYISIIFEIITLINIFISFYKNIKINRKKRKQNYFKKYI